MLIKDPIHNFFEKPAVFWFQRQKETIFVFVHLPRCAGTYLLKSFRGLGSRRQIVVSESPDSKAQAHSFVVTEIQSRKINVDKLELIAGHDAYFGIHDVSPRKPFYFTFVRDPVDRYLSNFRFLRDCAANPKSRVHSFAVEAMLDNGKQRPLEELIEQGRLANMMTHYLAASVDPDLETGRWHCEDDTELLRLAKSAIDRFQFVGFFDRLQEDAQFICDRLKVPLKVQQINQTKSQFANPVSKELREKVATLNWQDQEVFDYARASLRR